MPHFLVLIEEGGDETFFHEFLFLREDPCHAVDEDDVFRPAVDVAYVGEEGSVAEADDGVALVDVFPLVFAVYFDAASDDVEVEGFSLDAGRIRDDVDFPAEGLPQNDLVVEFRSRSAVNAGKSVDENFLFLFFTRLSLTHECIVTLFEERWHCNQVDREGRKHMAFRLVPCIGLARETGSGRFLCKFIRSWLLLWDWQICLSIPCWHGEKSESALA